MEKMTGSKRLLFVPKKIALCGLLSFLLVIGTTAAPDSSGFDTAALTERLDQEIRNLRAGQTVSNTERYQNREAFEQYFEALSQKHNVKENNKFSEPDRTDFYVNAIKMSLLDSEKHSGWAFRSELGQAVRLELLHRLDLGYDPFLAFCVLFPALKRGETEYAVGAYEAVEQSDPFLASKVIEWSAEYLGQLDWLATPYLQAGQSEKVRQIATDVKRLGTSKALVCAGTLYERVGDLTEAETVFKQIEDEVWRVHVLTLFYCRHLRDLDDNGVPFQQHCDALRDRLFANGLEKVSLAALAGPPRSGFCFTKSSRGLEALGIRPGDVVVAVDGYRFQTQVQYFFIRNLDIANERMTLIVWNGQKYAEIDALVKGRLFGVDMKDYVP